MEYIFFQKNCECIPLSGATLPAQNPNENMYGLPLNLDLWNYYSEFPGLERDVRGYPFVRAARSNDKSIRQQYLLDPNFNNWMKRGRGSIRRKYLKSLKLFFREK